MNMDFVEIDVLCPLYNAERDFSNLIKGIRGQKNVKINHIIFPVTESTDNTFNLAKSVENSIAYLVEKKDFSHSLTREKAVYQYATATVVIFMTQDVILHDQFAFYNLAKSIRNDIVHAFARQLTKSNDIEKYTRKMNYPEKSYTVGFDDIERLQLKAFYSSDACAAYNREKFIELGGFDEKKMQVSEDMYYCRKAILNGYKIMYCAESVVTHSHSFTIKQVYRRYYDIGIFFKQNPEFKAYKSIDSGLKLAWYILKQAIKHFDVKVLIRWLPDMLARYFGKRNGEKS